MFKHKGIFKIYIGLFVFGAVFSFNNLNKYGFSLNIVKAMEYCNLKSEIWQRPYDEFIKMPLDEPNEDLIGARNGDLVLRKDVSDIYEKVKQLREQTKNDDTEYVIYNILCVIAYTLLRLDERGGVIGDYKALYNDWVNKNKFDLNAELASAGNIDITMLKKVVDVSLSLFSNKFNDAIDICNKNINVMSKLEVIKNNLDYIKSFFEFYAVGNVAVYYFNRLNMYLIGWIKAIKEIDLYYRIYLLNSSGSLSLYAEKNFNFTPDDEYTSDAATNNCVEDLKTLAKNNVLGRRYLGDFFTKRLVNLDIYSTYFKEEDKVTCMHLWPYCYGDNGNEIKCINEELYNLIEKIVGFEYDTQDSSFIQCLKDIYNKSLEILQKREIALNNEEKEHIKALYARIKECIIQLESVYSELDCLTKKIKSSNINQQDSRRVEVDDDNYHSLELDCCKKIGLYLNSWIRTLVGKRELLKKKFSFLDDNFGDFFEKNFDVMRVEELENTKVVPTGKYKQCDQYEELFFMYYNKWDGCCGSNIKGKLDDFKRDNNAVSKQNEKYLEILSRLNLYNLIDKVMNFDICDFNKFKKIRDIILKSQFKYKDEDLKKPRTVAALEEFREEIKEHNANISKKLSQSKDDNNLECMIYKYKLNYYSMCPILKKFSYKLDGSYDENVKHKVLSLYEDTIKAMLTVKKLYSDMFIEIIRLKIKYKEENKGWDLCFNSTVRRTANYVKSLVLAFARIVKEISARFSFVNKQEILDGILAKCPPLILSEYSTEDVETVKIILDSFSNVKFKNLIVRFKVHDSGKKKVKDGEYEYDGFMHNFYDVNINLGSFFEKDLTKVTNELTGMEADDIVQFAKIQSIAKRLGLEYGYIGNKCFGSDEKSNTCQEINTCQKKLESSSNCGGGLNCKIDDLGNTDNKSIQDVNKVLSELRSDDVLGDLCGNPKEFLDWFYDFVKFVNNDVCNLEASFKEIVHSMESDIFNVLEKGTEELEQKKQEANKILTSVVEFRRVVTKVFNTLIDKRDLFIKKFAKKLSNSFKDSITADYRSICMYMYGLHIALGAMMYAIELRLYELTGFIIFYSDYKLT